MTTWNESADLVVIGSGGGALVAAIAAADAGLTALVVEKQGLVGGSTAMSGGVIWLPNNPLMQREGVADSEADGLAYFADVVGDVGPASSEEKRRTFISAGSTMVTFLERAGLRLTRCEGYSDYYSEHRGGHVRGRAIEPVPYDARRLGEWRDRIQPGLAKRFGFVVKTNETRVLLNYNRSLGAFLGTARVVLRTWLGRLRRQDLLTNGASLVAQLLRIALDRGIPVWRDSAFDDLIVSDGRVVGVRVVRDGVPVTVRAHRGVLVAAGGFAHNAAMRRKYSGEQPNEGQWSGSNPGDTGEVLDAVMRLGARTDLMDEAWWSPASVSPALAGSTLAMTRQRPGSIFVDSAGERFCNEANSYVEVGKAMYARNRTAGAVPCWLIFDDGVRRRYVHTKGLPGRMPREWIDSGAVVKGDTLRDLAASIGVDADGLTATVDRFNRHAAEGLDPDHGRGQSAFNRVLGDPGRVRNPAVGPLARAPFYATRIHPSDVGTCGGLVTDSDARVLGEDGEPIPGLYAAGNITATVMGRHYLGAGASIANSMVFGFVAARHAARSAVAGPATVHVLPGS